MITSFKARTSDPEPILEFLSEQLEKRKDSSYDLGLRRCVNLSRAVRERVNLPGGAAIQRRAEARRKKVVKQEP